MNYFKQNSIKSITLQGDNSLIEYQDSTTEIKLTSSSSEIQKVKSYLDKIGKSKLFLSDLEQESNDGGGNTKKPTNYLPRIIGGGFIFILVIIIIWLLIRNKEK